MYVWHVWNPCWRQPEPGKVFQICNMIYKKGIYMIRGGGIFRTWDVWECNVPFRGCHRSHDVPLSIVKLLIIKFMFGISHVGDNHKLAKYCRYVIWFTSMKYIWLGGGGGGGSEYICWGWGGWVGVHFQHRGCLRINYHVCPRFRDVPLWIVYLSFDYNIQCFVCIDCMFQSIRRWTSIADMLYDLYKYIG